MIGYSTSREQHGLHLIWCENSFLGLHWMSRLFVAIKIPDDVINNLLNVCRKLTDTHLEFKWEQPEKIHVTLKFIGEVDHRGKVKLLKDAAVLFALIQWEEPFGLFVVEALACGTPVIASGRGAMPELIKDGKTGFLVDNVSQAVKAVRNINKISRQGCRKLAEDRFSVEKMADDYLKTYYRLLTKK